jgi:hypothetical protein
MSTSVYVPAHIHCSPRRNRPSDEPFPFLRSLGVQLFFLYRLLMLSQRNWYLVAPLGLICLGAYGSSLSSFLPLHAVSSSAPLLIDLTFSPVAGIALFMGAYTIQHSESIAAFAEIQYVFVLSSSFSTSSPSSTIPLPRKHRFHARSLHPPLSQVPPLATDELPPSFFFSPPTESRAGDGSRP